MYRPEDQDPDTEKWIHRDKLAKIENEELQGAGLRLPKQRATSRGRRATSRDGFGDESAKTEQSDHWASARAEKRPRILSMADERVESPESEGWDLRTPEEVAAIDSGRAAKKYGNPVVRKNGSKIPVLTSSPLPIPAERLDRDTPIPRKRNFSGSIEDDDMSGSSRLRTRGNSFGSQVLLDETDVNTSTPGPANDASFEINSAGPASPTIAKPDTKLTAVSAKSPPSTAQKVTPAGIRSTPTTHKPRVPSSSNNASPLQNATSRPKDPDRPKTAVNRPEGEAPWLATMYKPDPRLPQDQQIIPTLAKKQQQEQQRQQADKEGSTPSSRGRGRSPPSQADPEEKKAASDQPQPSLSPPAPELEKKDDPNAWPLKPITRVRTTSTNRPDTSGSGTGGYSTMPKVIGSPLNSPPIGPLATPGVPAVPQATRQSPPSDELSKHKEKSCGCCVVM